MQEASESKNRRSKLKQANIELNETITKKLRELKRLTSSFNKIKVITNKEEQTFNEQKELFEQLRNAIIQKQLQQAETEAKKEKFKVDFNMIANSRISRMMGPIKMMSS